MRWPPADGRISTLVSVCIGRKEDDDAADATAEHECKLPGNYPKVGNENSVAWSIKADMHNKQCWHDERSGYKVGHRRHALWVPEITNKESYTGCLTMWKGNQCNKDMEHKTIPFSLSGEFQIPCQNQDVRRSADAA